MSVGNREIVQFQKRIATLRRRKQRWETRRRNMLFKLALEGLDVRLFDWLYRWEIESPAREIVQCQAHLAEVKRDAQ